MSGLGIYYAHMAYPPKTQRNKEIIRKYDKGWSLRQLGDHYGLHHSSVDEIIKRWYSIYGKKQLSGLVDK